MQALPWRRLAARSRDWKRRVSRRACSRSSISPIQATGSRLRPRSCVMSSAKASAMPSSFSAFSASWVGWVSKGISFGSVKELRATDVGVGDRRRLGRLNGPAAVETVVKDRFHRGQGARIDRQRPVAGGLEPFRAVTARQPQDAEAGAEALLGVRPVAQDDVDEDRGGGPDAGGTLAQHLGRDLGMTAMARGHVVVQRGGAHVARSGAPVTGHALAAAEDLDGAGGQPRPELLADQLVRDRVVVPLEPDVVVQPDRRLAPVGMDEGLRRQRLHRRALDRLEEVLTRSAEVAADARVQAGDLLADGGVQLLEAEELPVAQAGDDPALHEQDCDLDLRLVAGLVGTGR